MGMNFFRSPPHRLLRPPAAPGLRRPAAEPSLSGCRRTALAWLLMIGFPPGAVSSPQPIQPRPPGSRALAIPPNCRGLRHSPPTLPNQPSSSLLIQKERQGEGRRIPTQPCLSSGYPTHQELSADPQLQGAYPKAAVYAYHPSRQVSFSCWLDAGGWRRGASCPAVPDPLGCGHHAPQKRKKQRKGLQSVASPRWFFPDGLPHCSPIEKVFPFGTTILRCAAGSCCQWPGAAGSLHTVPYPPPDGALSAALRP